LISLPRFNPAIVSAFLAGLLLLFLGALPENIKSFFIPSLIIYSLGATLIGTFHRILGILFEKEGLRSNEIPIPLPWKIVVWILHFVWFAALVGYNFWRCVF
jgi:ABC-type multidrug transport system permease subunit